MAARLIESLATTEAFAELFSDASVLQAMLDFEVGLARAEARVGIVPESAADAIAAAATPEAFDAARLAQDGLLAGALPIPFVKALTERVRARDSAAAGFVHWGATSQDVADTALVLLLKRARPVLESDLPRLQNALTRLGETHANSVMLGRTLLQAAPPITFGLKAAGWFSAIERCRARVASTFDEALIVQLGGATGTLASLGGHGTAVTHALAEELQLGFPEAPWHTQRDRLAALMCACGVLTGALGKMARDVSLLMQTEIAEVAEPLGPGRGGSSTMPHKRNPSGCVVALAAATRAPHLVASFLFGMVQEHERAAGSWQAEWPTVAALMQATGAAAASMAEVAEGLTVDPARMRANLDATLGAVFAERAMMLLGAKLGRDVAHKLLDDATRKSVSQKRHLTEVLSEMPEVTRHMDSATLKKLEVPEEYLGSADAFRRGLLGTVKATRKNTRKDAAKEKE
ncbi:MAG: 3-carboxy-cis,cis-muconate cycloisomerase [Terriglobales bacterium]